MKPYIDSIVRSLELGFPLIAVCTPDYQDTLGSLEKALVLDDTFALLHWDMARGALGVNKKGEGASKALNQDAEPAVTSSKPEECLQRALDLMPKNSVLVMDDVHLLFDCKNDVDLALYIQCVRNVRDPFKSSGRALIMLCPSIKLPVELVHDVTIVEAPMPSSEDRKARAVDICKAANAEPPDEAGLNEVSDITRGLTMFGAENLLALAVGKNGYDLNILRRGSVAAVNAVAGLSVIESKMTFADLVGLEQTKKYGAMKAGGKSRPAAVVLMDEMSDQQAGVDDSNGINRDARGVMLGAMQNNDWRGAIFSGVAGTGKTQMAGAIADACGAMFINWDQGAMKGGIVSDSERMIRAAVSTLYERFGSRVFFVGTTNSVEEIAPQMKRRFGAIFFFDVLTSEQQAPIWVYYKKKFEITDESLPTCDGWTGAEIERCSEIAWEFGVPLTEAAQFITPVVMSMGNALDKMREGASGKYLSASYPGYFQTKRALDTKKVRAMINAPKPSQN